MVLKHVTRCQCILLTTPLQTPGNQSGMSLKTENVTPNEGNRYQSSNSKHQPSILLTAALNTIHKDSSIYCPNNAFAKVSTKEVNIVY